MARVRTTQVSQLFTRVLIATFQQVTMLQPLLFRTISRTEAYGMKRQLRRHINAQCSRSFCP